MLYQFKNECLSSNSDKSPFKILDPQWHFEPLLSRWGDAVPTKYSLNLQFWIITLYIIAVFVFFNRLRKL